LVLYELKVRTAKIDYKDRYGIKKGVTFKGIEPDFKNADFRIWEEAVYDVETLKLFDNEYQALNRLKEYTSYTNYDGTKLCEQKYFEVTEYYVERNEYENGDWIAGGDILAVSDDMFRVLDVSDRTVIASFNSYKDMEEYQLKLKADGLEEKYYII
jgi:hypothetical protein